MVLTSDQINEYYKTQGTQAKPLSPAEYEASLKPAPVMTSPTITTATADTQIQKNQTDAANLGVKIPGVGDRTTPATGPTPEATQTLRSNGGTYQGMDGKTYYSYDSTPVSTKTTAPPGESAIDINDPDAVGKFEVERAAQREADTVAFNKRAEDIMNGVIPLTPGQQAQIAGMQQQYQAMIDQQKITNKGAEGTAQIRGYQTGAAEYDNSFQVKTIGAIAEAGTNKVLDLQTKMASAVAELTTAFQEKNILQAKEAYDRLQTTQKEYDKALQDHVDKVTAAIKEAKAEKQKITDEVNKVAEDVLKNTGDSKLAATVAAAGSVSAALTLAGDSLQTATGEAGDYLAYKRAAITAGHAPKEFEDWQAAKEALDTKNAASKAYAVAYATENAKSQFVGSDKNQQKLEQQYRSILAKELSNRTGGLGLQDSKVNQAVHLKALYDSYYDPKTKNYNIPTAQYSELVLGLANLLSPTGNTSEGERAELKSRTAAGNLKGAVQYVTGEPQNGNTQAIIKNLVDSINRQGVISEQLRDQDVLFLQGLAPTDLEPDRRAAMEKNLLPSFINPTHDPLIKDGIESKQAVDSYIESNPEEAEAIASMYDIPGITDDDIIEYLQQNGKI